jgi:trans-aconitate 2-methyltransferase
MAASGIRLAWDPAQYGRFADARLRPVHDLIAQLGRLLPAAPKTIVDLGCGGGQATRLLAQRFRTATVTGLDADPAMLATARLKSTGAQAARVRYVRSDIATWSPRTRVDVVFANASLHWVPGHETLFPRLIERVRRGGALAVQMPLSLSQPSHVLMRALAAEKPWRQWLAGLDPGMAVAEAADYDRWLAPHAVHLDIWQTTYLHALQGPDPVANWTRGSGLRPYLAALPEDRRDAFFKAYARLVAEAYPPTADGRVLYPFSRLFMVAVAR